jgi:hypothetical protein
MTAPPIRRAPDVYTHPLWGLACVLGDIALRLQRTRAGDESETTPETRKSTTCEGTRQEVRR